MRVAVVGSLVAAWSFGCASGGEDVSRAHLTVPVPAVSEYVVLASRSISIGDRSVVSGGDLGVAAGPASAPGTLAAGNDARVGVGQVLLAERVLLGARAVAGEIGADRIDAPNATTGPRSAFEAPPERPTPGTVFAGGPSITVAVNTARTLAPGRYGVVRVNAVARLNLSGGLYQIQSLRLGLGARVVALSASTVRIAEGLSAGVLARLDQAPGLRAGDLRLVVNGTVDGSGDAALFEVGASLRALVVARHAFRTAPLFHGVGAISATDVAIGSHSQLAFETGFGCGAGAGCDDGDACSTDACLDALCRHDPAADGTACSDDDVCTGGDSCQAGTCTPGPPIVTEYPTGLRQPDGIVAGSDGNLWFISPETRAGGADGSVGRVASAGGVVTSFPAGRRLLDIAAGPDGNLWLAEQLPAASGGLTALRRIAPTGMFFGDLIGLPATRIAAGPDGNIWFASDVGELTVAGAIRPADGLVTAILFLGTTARAMTGGPDGNVWVAGSRGGGVPARISRVTPNSVVAEFHVDTSGDLNDITSGPDGNLWFTDEGRNEIGRITVAGAVSKYAIPTAASGPHGITTGPDGNLWFTERLANRLGRITPAGEVTELACIPSAGSGPTSVAAGADGGIWFTLTAAGKVARLAIP